MSGRKAAPKGPRETKDKPDEVKLVESARAYYVKGDDEVLVREAATKLLSLLAAQANDTVGNVVEDLSGDRDLNAEDRAERMSVIAASCQSAAFVPPLRVVYVRNIGIYSSEEAAPLIEYLADPLPSNPVVVAAGLGATSVKLVNAIKKVGHVIDVTKPGNKTLPWIIERIGETALKLDARAGQRLADHLGEDLARVGGILANLEAAYGPTATISADELEPFLGDAGGVPPWDLTDAVERGDIDEAIVQLHRMMDGGDRHPLVLLATLNSYFTNMLKVDGAGVTTEAEAAQLLGIHPFRAKKTMQQARKLGSTAIGDAIVLLSQADLDLKGQSQWPGELVLEVLVARLCRLARLARR